MIVSLHVATAAAAGVVLRSRVRALIFYPGNDATIRVHSRREAKKR
jgi:hypothetical protein